MGEEAENNRRDPRSTVLILVNARIAGAEATVKIRNISAHGAMIDSPFIVEVGSDVALQFRRIGWVDARVAWVEAGKCGVEFAEEIDPALAKEAIPVPPARPLHSPLRRV